MSGFGTGFATGLANSLKEGVDDRSQQAKDYFEKQYELARTVGIQNHLKVETAVEGSVKVAKQLQQMGVPKEIIMAVAAQDPLSLGEFYKEIADAQSKGVVIDQGFYDDFVEVSDDFKAPDEDFGTFFRRALVPIGRTATADPEGFSRDRKGGILGAMFGVDPIGRAQKKLDETIIIDGLSASDLAAYGENYSPPGIAGAPTVTFDYSKTRKEKGDELDGADRDRLFKAFEETWMRIRTEENVSDEEAKRMAVDELLPLWEDLPGHGDFLRRLIPGAGGGGLPVDGGIQVEELPEQVADDALEELGMEPSSTEPVATPTAPVEGAEPPTPTTTPTAPTGASPEAVRQGPIAPQEENMMVIEFKEGVVLQWYRNENDGTAVYTDNESPPNEYPFDPVRLRQFVAQQRNK